MASDATGRLSTVWAYTANPVTLDPSLFAIGTKFGFTQVLDFRFLGLLGFGLVFSHS